MEAERVVSLIAGLLAITMAAVTFAAPRDSTYRADADDSLLYVQIFNATGRIGSTFAHDHVVRASQLSATLVYDPADPRGCELYARVPVRELVADEPALRRRLGYEESVSQEQREKIRDTMLGKNQLYAERYPYIELAGEDCVPSEDARVFDARISLTIRGKTVTDRIAVRIEPRNEKIITETTFTMRHADFGMKPYSAFLGAVANAEPIRFHATLVFRRG